MSHFLSLSVWFSSGVIYVSIQDRGLLLSGYFLCQLKVMTQVSSSFTRKVLLRADGFSPAAVPIFKLRQSHPLSVILGENTALRGFDYFLANCDKTLKAHLVYFLFQIWSLPFFQEALVSFL